jgi:hypothetical protein
MGNANRLLGYLASFLCASLFYIVWFAIESWTSSGNVSLLFHIGIAVFFWLFEGMAAALVLMALPWYLAVVLYERLQSSGLIYFALIGAATTTVIGCATASLAPKPLFIEDQTFLQGFMIAVERQGICMLLAGIVFGGTFWLVSERRRRVRFKNAAQA